MSSSASRVKAQLVRKGAALLLAANERNVFSCVKDDLERGGKRQEERGRGRRGFYLDVWPVRNLSKTSPKCSHYPKMPHHPDHK